MIQFLYLKVTIRHITICARKGDFMKKERALEYWINRYNSAKDYNDIHWDAEERHEHRDYIRAMEWAIKAIEGYTDVQPIVHCKDCKYRKEHHYEAKGETPYVKYSCKFTTYSMSGKGFCSIGRRAENDT